MARKPAPMTPADCDLRGLPFMPLHGERLVESDLFFESTGDEFKAAVALWWASWKQVPAASLPNNPRVLAGLARVPDATRWAAISEGALHGWALCSDGRLYHPVVAALALEAWDDRQEHRAGREAENERKRLEREERKRLFADLKAVGVHLAWNAPLNDLRARHAENCPQPVQDLSAGQVQDRPRSVPAIEGTGTGTNKKNPQKPPEGAFSPEFLKAWDHYPEDGKATTNREASFAAWEPEALAVGADRLAACVVAYSASLTAKGDRAKSAPKFHVWLRDKRYETFLKDRGAAAVCAWAGPPDVLGAVELHKGRGWAISYLAKCRWDAEARSPTASSVVAAMLRQEAGSSLRAIGVEILAEEGRAA